MKYVLVIGDGMADNPLESLDGKTPLQTADKPYMDRLAEISETGSVRTVPVGAVPGSDTAILSIFGYDPTKYYTGRAPLEAAGCGVTLKTGDIALRCNMVTLEPGDSFKDRIIVSHSAGSIDGNSAVTIMNALLNDADFAKRLSDAGMSISVNESFRHIAVLKGGNIEGLVTTPPHEILGKAIGEYLPCGNETGDILREIMESSVFMEGHPANDIRKKEGKLRASAVWFWAEGTVAELTSFKEKYNKSCAVISAVPLVRGIGSLAGADWVEVEGATGDLHTNYEGKVQAALDALKNGYDFAVVHIEAPDECSHDGDLSGKLRAINYLSERVIKPLDIGMKEMQVPYRMLILSDHKTLLSTRGHDGDPVPFMLYDSSREDGQGRPYDEESCVKGRFIEDGTTLMEELFKF